MHGSGGGSDHTEILPQPDRRNLASRNAVIPGMTIRKVVRVFLVAAAILAIPLIMMQVSDEWDWDLADFIIIGALMVGAGVIYELIASRLKTSGSKLALLVLAVIAVIYVWAELAVGIFF